MTKYEKFQLEYKNLIRAQDRLGAAAKDVFPVGSKISFQKGNMPTPSIGEVLFVCYDGKRMAITNLKTGKDRMISTLDAKPL